jgi:methyltransferase-like protein
VAEQVRTDDVVTNQWHSAVRLDAVARRLASMLDGTRDRAALLAELVNCAARGELNVSEEDRTVTDEDALYAVMEVALDQALGSFEREALLVG